MKLRASIRIRNAAMIKWRRKKGFNQREASAFCGLPMTTWMRLETLDYPKRYPVDRLIEMACITGIPIDEIMPEELQGQNLGKTLSQEVDATNAQMLALAGSQDRYFERSLLSAPDEVAEQNDTVRSICEAVQCLPDQERLVMSARFGLGGVKQQSRAEVAKALGVSRGRVSQCTRAAIQEIQRVMIAETDANNKT